MSRPYALTARWTRIAALVLLSLGTGLATAPGAAGDEPPLPGASSGGQGAPVGEPQQKTDKQRVMESWKRFADPVRVAEIKAAEEAGRQILRLTLQDALKLGAAANLGLLAGSYEAPIAHQGFIAADAGFDTLLTANLDLARDETPVANFFQGTGTLLDKRVGAAAGVTRSLRSGGSVSLLYRADRLSTNLPFQFLNPSVLHGTVLEASQPLLRGAGDVALSDIRRAQNAVSAAKATYAAQVQDTLLDVLIRYWELVFSLDNLAARRQSEEVARELLSDAQARLDAEVGTPLAVAEARAGVERRVSEVLRAENLRATVQDQLLALIVPFAPTVSRRIYVAPLDMAFFNYKTLPVPSEEQRYIQLAIVGRPELRAQKANIATRGVDVIQAFDAIRPQLDLRGSVGTQGLGVGYGGSFRNMVDGSAVSGAIGIEFSMFIGLRGPRALWRAAAWRRRQAHIDYKELENRVIVDVRLALRDIQTARGQVAAGYAEVKAADENVTGERLRLEQGKSTPFNVLLKVNELTDAQTRLSRAATDVRQSEGRLWRAVGSLVDRVQVDVSKWEPCPDCPR